MQTLSNIAITADAEAIKNIIATHGHAAEHNYNHFINIGEMMGECSFCIIDNNFGIMSYKNKNDIWCYSDPIAPEEKRLEIFLQFVECSFENGAKKVRAEVNEKLWAEIIQKIKLEHKNKFRTVKPSYIYQWPVYDLKKWDMSLTGIKWKKLRNMRNAFTRDHKIEIFHNASNGTGSIKENFSQQELINFLKKWKKLRQGKDMAHTEHYESAIKSNFEGYDFVRLIYVDGAIAALNGGWKIANSNNVYLQLGLPNYGMKNIGDFSYLNDLEFFKSIGFDFADLGGSTPEMMHFKNKFSPAYVYRTVEFSIVEK